MRNSFFGFSLLFQNNILLFYSLFSQKLVSYMETLLYLVLGHQVLYVSLCPVLCHTAGTSNPYTSFYSKFVFRVHVLNHIFIKSRSVVEVSVWMYCFFRS